MTRWEYRTEIRNIYQPPRRGPGSDIPQMTTGWINELGSEGWDLVSVNTNLGQSIAANPIYLLFFKRPLP